MAAKVFTGVNVFVSRNLVPPELFDALHDALKLNGAQVFLCCDPSRNGPNDYHVISSSQHEKFEDLRSKGCKMLGPQCVLSCAKEHRSLPNQGFTCCLGMDGVNILVSGFDMDEKVNITKMVTEMGGALLAKASSDVSFVIVKNVLAQKYKWALNSLRKPIVTLNWLIQCWKEHRVVPQESYRVLPFSGLVICVSGIPADERKKMENLVIENNGKYSPELTKRCTHLVCDAPEGDKYKVAKRWGHIHIVTREWFRQSVTRRACLNELSYPVLGSSASSLSTIKIRDQYSDDKLTRNSQYASSLLITSPHSDANLSAQDTKPDLEISQAATYSTFSQDLPLSKEEDYSSAHQRKNDSVFDGCIADDSQSETDDLYLSECRILLVGFGTPEMRKLVDMVRRGGGSRYMYFSEKLTHLVVGNPSENETKEARNLAANGVVHVVKTAWLEDCTCKKKEVPVLPRHIAYELLLPKDPVFSNKRTAASVTRMNQEKSTAAQPVGDDNIWKNSSFQSEVLLEETDFKSLSDVNNMIKHRKSSAVFEGKLFRFSSSFPEEQRPEILQWVKEGGGEVASDQYKKNVHFIVERHGVVPCLTDFAQSTYVSSHWIHSCIEDGCLLDVGSHLLYSPLPCQIPLPGFEGYRFCVSRYETKERQLLRNLCYVLGVKLVEKLTKKVTHLLCKYADGDKHEAARRWGIQIVTAEWIYECAMQNKVVDLKVFYPKEPTSLDREAGLSIVSQCPSQSVRMLSEDDASLPTKSQDLRNTRTYAATQYLARDGAEYLDNYSKRARVLEHNSVKIPLSCVSTNDYSVHTKNTTENSITKCTQGVSLAVPDVAAAIEDLLEQTSKIQDPKTQETSGCNENILSSTSTMLDRSSSVAHSEGISARHWVNRSSEGEDNPSGNAALKGSHDGFSETQTDSQVVGYEEDLSGRQMIIERVRIRSSLT